MLLIIPHEQGNKCHGDLYCLVLSERFGLKSDNIVIGMSDINKDSNLSLMLLHYTMLFAEERNVMHAVRW